MTAWTIVDRNGMAALSTQTLAAALNVKSPALYWYVHSKDELLSPMMEQLLQNSLNDAPPNLAWAGWLEYVGTRQRTLLQSHRDGGLIASLAAPTERLRTKIFPGSWSRCWPPDFAPCRPAPPQVPWPLPSLFHGAVAPVAALGPLQHYGASLPLVILYNSSR